MATMKSVMVEEIGKPAVIRERPVPEPKEGEIQIKVSVVGCKMPFDNLFNVTEDLRP